ncbi:MAG: PD40 domain-containing protein [Phycisphaerae bacterium]|nr:PD40 domain-containing protein [Phycisphaerae bacterium]
MIGPIIRVGGIAAIVLLGGFLLPACQEPAADPVLTASQAPPPPPPQPELAVSRDRQVTHFGELPGHGGIPYYSRASASLLRHTFVEEGADYDPDLNAGGERMLFCSTRHTPNPDLYIKGVLGTAVTQLTSDPSSDIHPQFSPDGTRVAFASNRAANWDIWIVGIDGQQPVQVTQGPADEVHPSWSPDGQRLVFCSLSPGGGQWELWVADAKAGATKRFIGYGVFPEWSPVDNLIVYQRARERGSRWFSIWTLELLDGEPRYPTEIVFSADFAAIAPTWSSDGSRIAFCAVASTPPPDADYATSEDTSDVWIVNIDGTGRVRLTDGHSRNFGPVWSPQGRVFFTSTRSGHENVWSIMPPTLPQAISAPSGSLTRHWEEGPPVPNEETTVDMPG